jgi:hypothetical protein
LNEAAHDENHPLAAPASENRKLSLNLKLSVIQSLGNFLAATEN